MEKYIPTDGIQLWTDVRGSSDKTLLLCAGGPGCCDYLLPVSQMVEDGCRVIRFEQRGCGRSGRDGSYDLHIAIRDIEVIREYYGVRSWMVGGHSWGANLALAYAIRHPEWVDELLYIAGNGVQNDREWSAQYHAAREQYGETVPEMAYDFNGEVNQQGNRSWRAYIQAPSLYRDISRLKTRSLILCAGADIRPNWPSMQIHALMPNAELGMIEGAAHFIWLTHAEEMRTKLRAFLGLD